MTIRKFSAAFLSFILTISIFTVSLPVLGYAQTSQKTSQTVSTDLQSRLSSIEAKLIEKQKELGIPGISLAIVKDGKVILSKGFGYKNFEKKIPVTAHTQFAIGSATKAFTGLAALISQDEGKLSLNDSPKKYIPYFKINDPEIDKNIQVRDLLCHSSGLNRTDLGWITGKLNAGEIIRVAGEAKPMAGLRKQFFYQNVMFLAAGELVGKVQKMPWEKVIETKIFAPLGMTNTTTSVKQMQNAKDFSFGYEYNFDTKETRNLPTREISAIAPAGAINSSSNDMAKWLQFVLNGGEVNGKQLVSKTGFDEWLKPQMNIAPNGSVSYGFGWFLQKWKDKKVVQHGGNIDGFNSMVAMIPEENLGFVMLTNVSASTLGNDLMEIVWSGILNEERSAPLSAQELKEVGKYTITQAGLDIEVANEDEKLVVKVPGQPTYTLENIKDRKYRLGGAPEGFYITFRESEAYLEQPQGNLTLPKKGVKTDDTVTSDDSQKELIGLYESDARNGSTIEIKDVDGKTSLVVGAQPPYGLEKKETDTFAAPPLPAEFAIKVKRDESGKIVGITLVQPQGDAEFTKIAKDSLTADIMLSADELLAKMIKGLGGEANIRRITSRETVFDQNWINQGVKGFGKSFQSAPNKSSSSITLMALGKKIGWINSYFNGTAGGDDYSFGRDETYTGARLEDAKSQNDFYEILDWKEKYEKVDIARKDKVGEADAYVVSIKPKTANAFTIYVSTKTFLPLRRIYLAISSTSPQKIPISDVYSDYRNIDGIMIPFKIVTTNPGMGDIITTVKEVKQNVKIPDNTFEKK